MHTTTQAVPNFTAGQTVTPTVCWASIVAGAFGATIISVMLVLLGLGMGLASSSSDGMSLMSIGWIVLTQIVAAAAGGYLAGRLGVQSPVMRSREAQFRDAAHGFLTWTVATLAVAMISISLIGKAVTFAMSSGAAVAGTAVGLMGSAGGVAANSYSAATADGEEREGDTKLNGMLTYMVDMLFRSDRDNTDRAEQSEVAKRLEAGRILWNNLHAEHLPEKDQLYLAKMVAKLADLSVEEATRRVVETFESIRNAVDDAEQRFHEAAERAQKIAAHTTLWTVVALVFGLIIASGAAASGGKQRDRLSGKLAPLS